MKKIKFEREALRENAKALKVLYVENHAGTRLKFGRLLKQYFGQVFVTTYADNAIKIFESGHFDLIITSANLPDMKTSTVCKKIKNIAPKKPIIIVSKNKNPDEIIELVNIGIAGFIQTPLDENQIIPILSRVVLEISDLEMIYSFQDTIEKELEAEKEAETQTFEVSKEEEEEDFEDDNLLNENNIELLLTKYDTISAKDFINNYPMSLNSTADKLLSINEAIDIHINNFIRNPTKENATIVSDEFRKFSNILNSIPDFSNMAFSVKKLSMIFETLDYTKDYKRYYDTILMVSDELMRWCDTIFISQNTDDIHYFDKSFLTAALLLESLLRRDLKKSNA